MDNEKLILFYEGEELIHKTIKIPSKLGAHFYCCHNNLELLEYYEMEAFVYIVVRRK